MKRQIRRGVFETNSSSVHSLTIVMEDEYKKWENGELIYDRCNDKLVPVTEEIKEKMKSGRHSRYLTYEQFDDFEYNEYETYEESCVTPLGEKVIVFGYYGNDY